jgi:hypothetical protein
VPQKKQELKSRRAARQLKLYKEKYPYLRTITPFFFDLAYITHHLQIG